MGEKRKPTKANRPRRDGLPTIFASPLRAARIITPDMKTAELTFPGEDHPRTVELAHIKFPNRGGWSYFICPTCRRMRRRLRLLDGEITCRQCDGLLDESQMASKAGRIARLEARLYAGKPPHRRKLLELSLRRARLVEKRERLKGWPPSQ